MQAKMRVKYIRAISGAQVAELSSDTRLHRGSNFLRKSGAPGAIPTRDLPLRRRTLYAAELREHEGGS